MLNVYGTSHLKLTNIVEKAPEYTKGHKYPSGINTPLTEHSDKNLKCFGTEFNAIFSILLDKNLK
jgi:hypothetical protein